MKALKVTGPSKIELCEMEVPKLQNNQVLIKVEYSAMCSSDVKLIKGNYDGLVYPCVPGHEWSGVVTETTEQNKHLLGRKVVVDILFPCLQCEPCRTGKRNLCTNLKEIGISLQGGFAEYVAVDAKNVIPISDSVSLKHACIIEPLAVVYNAIQRVGGIKPAEKVIVFGSGAVGLLVTALAKLMGATYITNVDYIESRLEVAKEMGATDTFNLSERNIIEACQNGEISQADVVFDVTGEAEAFNMALELVKPGGRVGYIGYTAYDTAMVKPSNIMLKAVNIYGVLSPTETWLQAIEIIEKELIDIDKIITHEYNLEEYEMLLKRMEHKEDGILRGVFKL